MAPKTVADKLAGIRTLMKRESVDAYIIVDSDPHQSEYLPEFFRARTWVSGFSGSAGTVVVTADRAGLWTDSRYYLEAEESLHGTPIELFRDGNPGVPPYEQWLGATLQPGNVVAFDDATYSVQLLRTLEGVCREQKIRIRPGLDFIAPVWENRPSLPADPIYSHGVEHSGRSTGDKLADARAIMRSSRSDYLLTAALDETAWLFNLRGADVSYNPVFLSYGVVTAASALLFVDSRKVDDDLQRSLAAGGVQLMPYDDILRYVERLDPNAGITVWPQKISVRLYDAIPKTMRVVEQTGPLTRLKAIKNTLEQEHLRNVMVRDGAALEKFFYWLSQNVEGGGVTELSAARRLREFRAADPLFVGESFETIAGYRGHGAIVHYGATPETDVELGSAGLLLVDSGGQYRDGTTDITRVAALGAPTVEERQDYTLVLKAHIALATVRFPRGTSGQQLDTIARDVLWRHGLSYGHGTGHGVGFFLNVHEGPQRIGTTGDRVALEPGMYTSNEPGVYRAEKHGVRVENLVLVQANGATEFGEFLLLETVSLCHLEPELIDGSLLNAFEKSWVNAYQRRVFEKISPLLDGAEREWLRSKTRQLDIE